MPITLRTHDSCPNLSTKELLRAVALAATMLREERSQGECKAIAASLFQYVECLAARMPEDRCPQLLPGDVVQVTYLSDLEVNLQFAAQVVWRNGVLIWRSR